MNTRPSDPLSASSAADLDTRSSTTLLAASFPLFSLLLYLPAALYFANADEFTLRLRDLLFIFLPAFAISILAAFLVLRAVPRAVSGRLTALSLAFGVALWVQGSLLVWEYGTFDGRAIAWEEFRLNGVIDTPIWLFIIGAGLLAPGLATKVGRMLAIIVMSVQGVILVLSAGSSLQASEEGSARKYSVDNAPKYAFSAHQNIILFVLDSFQADAFEEIIRTEPKYARFFEGFTWFRDAVAVANYTELAIPGLLTGQMYDNSETRDDFLRDAYLETGIVTTLKRAGFIVDIYPWLGWGNESIYFDEAIASNLTPIDEREKPVPSFTEKNGKEALHLLDLSFFRAVPHCLKPWIFNDNSWLITYAATYFLPQGVKQAVATDDLFTIKTFLNHAPAMLDIGRGQQVFKYYHLKGAHSPLTVDENLAFASEVVPFSRRAYLAQAKANLEYLHQFFSKLREAGLYNSSLILVLGDHGSGESPEMWLGGADAEPMRLDGTRRNFRRDQVRALPLVLIKRIGITGPLQHSDAPVSLRDIPATILSELGMEPVDGRPSMFEVPAGESRTRYHAAFEFSPSKSGYVEPITLYRIDGDSWLQESWTVDRILYPASEEESVDSDETRTTAPITTH